MNNLIAFPKSFALLWLKNISGFTNSLKKSTMPISIVYLIVMVLYICNYANGESSSNILSDKSFFTEKSIYETDNSIPDTEEGCVVMDGICISIGDVSSYEAIKSLHAHLDDDHSGDIDLSESVDFLREELNYTKGLEKRQKAFHHNNDQHISVQELWDIWLANEVHNWTVEQTVGWLHVCVELGQYADVFYENAINGSVLPRLATNNDQFLNRILGIKNPTHRSKISIKAMDIVLFGPPKETGSFIKDVFIASLICVIVVMLIKFNRMSRKNNMALRKMDQDMEALQEELLRFHSEKKVQEERNTGNTSKSANTEGDVGEENEENTTVSENIWDDGNYQFHTDDLEWDAATISDVPELDLRSKNELQLWLQLTYEKEKIVLENKIRNMKMQIEEARDMCDKLKPNRKNLFGALSFIHGKMESKGQPILEARAAFADIQAVDKEMEFRWGSMERLLGFHIIKNGGIDYLQLVLEPSLPTSMTHASSTAVGLASVGMDKGTETPTSTMSLRIGALDDSIRRRKMSYFRSGGSSVVSDAGFESGITSSHFSTSSLRSQSSGPVQNMVTHSQTIGAGLSNYGVVEDYRPRSSSNESKVRKLSNENHLNGAKSSSNENSTDDTDSGNFTVGESGAIKIDSVSIDSRAQSTPPHSPSLSSLQKSNKEEALRTLSDKVRTQRSRLRLLGKSYSQDEKGSLMTVQEKNINKYSSEPSLETEDASSQISHQDVLAKSNSKKGILGKSKFFNKFKSKPDKNK